jgi:hypothetical protein
MTPFGKRPVRNKRLTAIAGAYALLLLHLPALAEEKSVNPLTPEQVQSLGSAISTIVDGRTFSVDTGKEGKPAGGKDVVRFADGLMSTALCIRFGFKPAPYTVRAEGTKIHFRSEMISETQGKLVFTGHIEGDRLVAKAEWEQVRWYWTVNIVLWHDGKQVEFSDDLPVFIN